MFRHITAAYQHTRGKYTVFTINLEGPWVYRQRGLLLMTTLIAICFVTVTNSSSVVDTHHLRLGEIHHRQQVVSSSSFCPSTRTNRISWPLRPPIEKIEMWSDVIFEKKKNQPLRCVEAGVVRSGEGGGELLCAVPPWSLRMETQTSVIVSDWVAYTPNLDEWKARPVRKKARFHVHLSLEELYPLTPSRNPTPELRPPLLFHTNVCVCGGNTTSAKNITRVMCVCL